MTTILLQVVSDGFKIDPAWVIATLMATIGTLAAAIGVLWRQSVGENKRKDELIDKLIRQVGRTADVTDRTVSLAESRERTTRKP